MSIAACAAKPGKLRENSIQRDKLEVSRFQRAWGVLVRLWRRTDSNLEVYGEGPWVNRIRRQKSPQASDGWSGVASLSSYSA